MELPKTYKPDDVEARITERWNATRAFHADPAAPGEPYCIVIPPPNVTAALHMGHALNNTLQDILTRWHRMRGDNTLWMPGTDHAGIATQTVVEKRVLQEEKKKRTDFQRDEFVAKIQAWKDEYEAVITGQLKAMGCSCDWDRQRFTMDETCARAVREAFFRLFRDGLIYRGKRLVNWDPATQTALADDEVEMEEVNGNFYYLRYPLSDGSGHITVATTRPETMLGDTAVAINPKDPRAAALAGKKVRLPIVGRVIPIITDDYVVLPDPNSSDEKAKYATGFLKVTPAHDPNDWEIGLRHDLPVINVMAPDGTISDQHGWTDTGEAQFVLGQDRYRARKLIVAWFKDNDLLEEVKPYRHSVGHSYRSHVAIEPYLSDQWYVAVTDDKLAGAALRAMVPEQRTTKSESSDASWQGKLRFHPKRYARTFETWHENIRDWCISRQLWWGHRIPIWTYPGDLDFPSAIEAINHAKAMQRLEKDLELWSSAGRISYVRSPSHPSFEADFTVDQRRCMDIWHVCVRDSEDTDIIRAIESTGFTQDPDVLDTWFSSGLWPFSTLGWPEESPDLAKWNPGNLLCTAREIITLWVSRMVMFNTYLLDRLPFTDVFIHAMIQDGEGRKMSKSLGNGVDPLDIIHSHGSDAMRYTLAKMTTDTQDVRMPVVKDPTTGRNTSPKFDEGRNFANKLWNAGRFALSNLEGAEHDQAGVLQDLRLSLPDRWILSRLTRTIQSTNAALESYEFSDYASGLYSFFWSDLCDWYIEAVKPTVAKDPAQRRVLVTCLDAALKMMHPMMPFITETLWHRLNEVTGQDADRMLVRADWPTADASLIDDATEQSFKLVQEVVTLIRQVRTQQNTPPKQLVDLSITTSADLAERIREQADLIGTLANVKLLDAGPNVPQPTDAAATVMGESRVYLHGLVDADADRARLTRRAEELEKSIKTLEGRLSNKSYTDKAPAHLVDQTRKQLADAQNELASIREQIN